MKKYTGIDYEKNENCFQKTEHVQSFLLYGNTSSIKNPFFTVFIPTYKRPGMFREALTSVLQQWHALFQWEILVIDNEAYDGNENETERIIREIDNARILYYRNSENMRPGDNFNRGFALARGKWVMMLHDDDILVDNALQNMGELVETYSNLAKKKEVGAICASYQQIKHDPLKQKEFEDEVRQANTLYASWPICYRLYMLTRRNIWFTGNIGGFVPSNGSTFLKEAVIRLGGFNDDLGISADLILLYCLEKYYAVYSTLVPYGFYRWGNNTMSNPESSIKTAKNGYEFREFIYAKNPVLGSLMRPLHYHRFTSDVRDQHNNISEDKLTLQDFDNIYNNRPNKIAYIIFLAVRKIYYKYKGFCSKRIEKRIIGALENR